MKHHNPFNVVPCKHPGTHERWYFENGTGMTYQCCALCGRMIKAVFIDDLPNNTLQQVVKIIRAKKAEQQED